MSAQSKPSWFLVHKGRLASSVDFCMEPLLADMGSDSVSDVGHNSLASYS